MKKRVQKGLLLLLSLLVVVCSSQPAFARSSKWHGYSETGIASYYANRHQGKRTASGERYHSHLNSAAHMALPLGSKVKVTNLASGKSVVVKINDRGAFRRGRIIDLSRSAFAKIGNLRRGLIKVKVEVL